MKLFTDKTIKDLQDEINACTYSSSVRVRCQFCETNRTRINRLKFISDRENAPKATPTPFEIFNDWLQRNGPFRTFTGSAQTALAQSLLDQFFLPTNVEANRRIKATYNQTPYDAAALNPDRIDAPNIGDGIDGSNGVAGCGIDIASGPDKSVGCFVKLNVPEPSEAKRRGELADEQSRSQYRLEAIAERDATINHLRSERSELAGVIVAKNKDIKTLGVERDAFRQENTRLRELLNESRKRARDFEDKLAEQKDAWNAAIETIKGERAANDELRARHNRLVAEINWCCPPQTVTRLLGVTNNKYQVT